MQNQKLKTPLPGVSFAGPRRPRAVGAEATWRLIRVIAAVFSLVVALVMLIGHLSADAIDPLKSSDLKGLKDKLRLNPSDDQLKQEIRQLDLQLRARYFRQRSQSASGDYLLIAGASVFVIAATQCRRYRKQLPMPQPKTRVTDPVEASKLARWSVGAVGALAGSLVLLLSLGRGGAVPENNAGEKTSASIQATASIGQPPSMEELQRSWPRFRGPDGSGISPATNLPASWDAKTGAGIAWKMPVPSPGFNSPIVWGKRFYISGGDSARREVFCYDCANGQLLWHSGIENKQAAGSPAPEIPETTGYAASSMATDGRRVYVIFATGELAAFTLEGKQVWGKNLGPLKNPYGYASSLATWQDHLIVLLDQGESEDGKSKIYCFDGPTGQVIWQTPRKVGSSWATPLTFEAAGQPQVVALSIPWAISYSLTNGLELWRVECLSGEITPSPVFAGGLVLVPSPSDKLLAIRPDGHGDVAKTHVAWSTEENVPDVTSPVSNGELAFTLTTPGLLSCFDMKDGKKLWEHDFDMECHSSPSLAAGRIYLFGQKGAAVVTEAGREFKELFRTQMPDAFHASPAFTQDMIILRGTTNLWGLATAPGKETAAK
jgi:outer membrane protein assembly factor BamB